MSITEDNLRRKGLVERFYTVEAAGKNITLALNCPRREFSAETTQSAKQKLTLQQGEPYAHAPENPELRIFKSGKQMNCKACLDIFLIFAPIVLYAEKLVIQNNKNNNNKTYIFYSVIPC